MTAASDIATYLDDLLGAAAVPDYPGALNGLQLDHVGPVRGIAAAVDVSIPALEQTHRVGANFLIVHHGLFWEGARCIVGVTYRRLQLLFKNDIAVYSSHLPLDAHSSLGNNALLAKALNLVASGPFAQYKDVSTGCSGASYIPTHELVARVQQLVHPLGARIRVTPHDRARITRSWGICTGAGASSETLREAVALNIDTLVVGEGPHHTAVDAPDLGLVVIYAGHYATETFGVRAIAQRAAEEFNLPWSFVHVPSGL